MTSIMNSVFLTACHRPVTRFYKHQLLWNDEEGRKEERRRDEEKSALQTRAFGSLALNTFHQINSIWEIFNQKTK